MRIYLIRNLIVCCTLASCAIAAYGTQQDPPANQDKTCQGLGCVKVDPSPSPTPANQPSGAADPNAARPVVTIKRVFTNLPGDQKAIWTSPFHVRKKDLFWILPLAATSGGLIGSDEHSMARARSNADAVNLSENVANGGVAGLFAVPAAMYVWGSLQGAPRARETGLLSGEAVLNSLAVNEALKQVFGRDRPTLTGGQGRFFQGFGDTSFPSTHSTLAWTAASVIAHEYPDSITGWLAYGAAATVSVSRVTGRKHFPSDVVVGGALGWLIGRQVYNAHHDSELDTDLYGTFERVPGETGGAVLGSTYVPLDSWIYPALKHLAGMGYIPTQFLSLQPWTRRECKRQIEEAEYFAQDLPPDSYVAQTIRRLKDEFSEDGKHYYSAQIDSVYARYGQISGTPLRDSYHFGQTLWNDFGRPFDQGANMITGATASAVAGRFFFYTQGEYQHAPGRGPLTDAQRNLIAVNDINPVLPPAPVATIDRFYPIDMYAGVQMGEYAVTFGKQSQWLGPTETGALMVSNNADPMYSLRLTRTTPLVLPGFLKILGDIRGEFLVSKLSGHQFPARPFFNLQKLSFHLTENLEVGFTRASLWAGDGHPFTAHSFIRNFDLSDSKGNFGDRNDPGDRKSGFDFSYRLPGLRKWLTIYSDMYSDDDPSPLANPRRAAVNPGLYLSHVPKIPRLDLRFEASSTQLLTSRDFGPQFIYFNNQYHDSNTNKGFLFGNATGRDGRSYQGWSNYYFSPVTRLQLSYRQVKTGNASLPGGGTQSDAMARFAWEPVRGVNVDAFVQYERWLIPALRQNAQHDVTGQLELRYFPHWKLHAD